MSSSPKAEALVPQRQFAVEVVTRLRAAGHQALWAGGCVRDQLLGNTPKDYDIATSAPPDAVRELFGRRHTLAIGAAFGVITVRGPKGLDPIEVATFRTDGAYLDGRRPESVAFTDAEHDAQRRDFTINGLFFDPIDERVVDYVGGAADLAAGVIRAIGDPRQRFAEDKLRMLRAVRFASTLNFRLDAETLSAVRDMADQISVVSAERVGAELRRLLTHPHRRRGIELLASAQLLPLLLPEIAHHELRQDTIWNSALRRLDELADPSLPLALAALLVGAATSAQVRAVGQRLRLPTRETARAQWLVENLPLVQLATELPWPRLQRILTHDGAHELLQLLEAEAGEADAAVVRCRRQLALPAAELNPPPLVTGDDLIRAGIRSGKHFSELLDFLRDEQLEGRLDLPATAVEAAQRWVSERRGE